MEYFKNLLGFEETKTQDYLPQINCFGFNEQLTHLVIGTTCGYRIYKISNKDFNKLIFRENEQFLNGKEQMNCGIKCISPLSETRLLAFSTDNSNKNYPGTNVYILDDLSQKIQQIYKIYDKINQVKITQHYLAVKTHNVILFEMLSQKKIIEVINKDQQIPLAYSISKKQFAHTNSKNGEIIEINLAMNYYTDKFSVSKQPIIKLVYSPSGKYLACVKNKGISIKILSLDDDCVIQDCIRGSFASEIYDVIFTHDGKYLAVMSKPNGTIHIFKMNYKASLQNLQNFEEIKSDEEQDKGILIGSQIDLTVGIIPNVITGTRSLCKGKVVEKHKLKDHRAKNSNLQKYFMIFDKNTYKLNVFCTNGTMKIFEIKEDNQNNQTILQFHNEIFWYDIHDIKTEVFEGSVIIMK